MDKKCCPKDQPLLVHLEHHASEYEFFQGCEILTTTSGTALVFPLRKRAPAPLPRPATKDESESTQKRKTPKKGKRTARRPAQRRR